MEMDKWHGKQFDQNEAAHQTYAFAMDTRNMQQSVDEMCIKCGNHLQVYYGEERLYFVRCLHCQIVALTYATDPKEAALRTIGKMEREGGKSHV